MKPSWKNFNQVELSLATDNFNPENLLGKGGHAEVYKGCLPDGTLVAVKRLMKKEKQGKEEVRTGDFLTELGIIAHVNHPNATRLIGFGVEGGLSLVLQYSPHGSLTSLLHALQEKWPLTTDIRQRLVQRCRKVGFLQHIIKITVVESYDFSLTVSVGN